MGPGGGEGGGRQDEGKRVKERESVQDRWWDMAVGSRHIALPEIDIH